MRIRKKRKIKTLKIRTKKKITTLNIMTIRTLMATGFIATVLHHTLNQKRQFSFLVIAWSKKINGFYLTKNLCQQWNIKAISHTNTVDPVKHLNESQLPLNKYGTIEFAKNFKNFLCKLN